MAESAGTGMDYFFKRGRDQNYTKFRVFHKSNMYNLHNFFAPSFHMYSPQNKGIIEKIQLTVAFLYFRRFSGSFLFKKPVFIQLKSLTT